jgi:hypothetical protein
MIVYTQNKKDKPDSDNTKTLHYVTLPSRAHAVYENRPYTRDRSRIRHKKAKHHTGPQTGITYISSPKIDSKNTTKNLIHHRNPGSNIRTPYENQPTGRKPQNPRMTTTNQKTATGILTVFKKQLLNLIVHICTKY